MFSRTLCAILLAISAFPTTLAFATDTSTCAYRVRWDPDTPDKIKEALYYLIHTNRNIAAACARSTMLHTTKGPWIGGWSDTTGALLQEKYEPNYPQSSEFPNHPKGNIRTGGDGPFHPFIYPKLPDNTPGNVLSGTPNACGEEMVIGKEVFFMLPVLALDKGVKNAGRHSSLACVLASFCGFEPAKSVMDTHEAMSLADGPEDSRCDQWNNDHGLRAGRQLHDWLVNRKQVQSCSSSLDGIADDNMMPAFDLVGAPPLKTGPQGILLADTEAQIQWIERNCQRAVESMVRGGLLCIDRPKPLEPSTYRQPRGKLPAPLFGSCTPVTAAGQGASGAQAR